MYRQPSCSSCSYWSMPSMPMQQLSTDGGVLVARPPSLNLQTFSGVAVLMHGHDLWCGVGISVDRTSSSTMSCFLVPRLVLRWSQLLWILGRCYRYEVLLTYRTGIAFSFFLDFEALRWCAAAALHVYFWPLPCCKNGSKMAYTHTCISWSLVMWSDAVQCMYDLDTFTQRRTETNDIHDARSHQGPPTLPALRAYLLIGRRHQQ